MYNLLSGHHVLLQITLACGNGERIETLMRTNDVYIVAAAIGEKVCLWLKSIHTKTAKLYKKVAAFKKPG